MEGKRGQGFPDVEHDHRHCVGTALERAESLCAGRGVRLTDIRRRVLEIVWRGHRPVGAYDILGVLQSERRGAAPPTVYRALDFLRDQGLVHKVESLNAYVGCADAGTPHGGQFLICHGCGAVAELNEPRIDAVIGECAAARGFSTGSRATVEVEGLCPNCAEAGGGRAHPR